MRQNSHVASGIPDGPHMVDDASDGGGAALKNELLSTPNDWHCWLKLLCGTNVEVSFSWQNLRIGREGKAHVVDVM